MSIRKTLGLCLTLLSLLFWFIETASGYLLSNKIGEAICQEHYLQPVNGIVGDLSCGFNADMYTGSGLILLFLFGMFLLIHPSKSFSDFPNNEPSEA